MKTAIVVVLCTIAYVVCMDLVNKYTSSLTIGSTSSSNETTTSTSIYTVSISGSVVNPGSYTVTKDSNLGYLISLAGGLTENADTTAFNSNASLTNKGSYYISYTRVDSDNKSIKVSLNNATQATLDTLPGIGEVFASRIVEYRTSNGSFKTIEEIMNVKGIGETLFNSLKDLICL